MFLKDFLLLGTKSTLIYPVGTNGFMFITALSSMLLLFVKCGFYLESKQYIVNYIFHNVTYFITQ